jgi:hypothetical protein
MLLTTAAARLKGSYQRSEGTTGMRAGLVGRPHAKSKINKIPAALPNENGQ